MQKLILKFNAIVGRDHLPEIQEITKKLSLVISGVEEEKPIRGKRLRVVSVTGSKENLDLLIVEMAKFPAITTKAIVKSPNASWRP